MMISIPHHSVCGGKGKLCCCQACQQGRLSLGGTGLAELSTRRWLTQFWQLLLQPGVKILLNSKIGPDTKVSKSRRIFLAAICCPFSANICLLHLPIRIRFAIFFPISEFAACRRYRPRWRRRRRLRRLTRWKERESASRLRRPREDIMSIVGWRNLRSRAIKAAAVTSRRPQRPRRSAFFLLLRPRADRVLRSIFDK